MSVPAASGALEPPPSRDYIETTALLGEDPAMARRPAKRTPERPRRENGSHDPPPLTDRDKIIAAFVALLAEHAFEDIGFADLAARAGVSLAVLRGEFGAKLPTMRPSSRTSTARCWRAAMPTWPRSRRGNGCSTC